MSDAVGWQREAAWLVLSDGTPWIHPQTHVEHLDDGRVRLHAHKSANYAVTLRPEHPLAAAARSLHREG